jgi:hypothetical protein
MKTQLSRDSFNRDKRYSGVYLQQGRMITDADWNEEAEIAKRRLDDSLADAVASGVPREHGLKFVAAAGQPLRLTRGRLYADGVGALVTGTQADPSQPFGLGQQADFPLPDGVVPPAVSYRLYADVWERSVTSLEDPDQLRDPAFHGADTASRTQTMAQLKWCAAAADPEDPAVNPPLGDARLTLTLRRQVAGLDPCDPCASEVSVPPRIGNYLFRLEVHGVEGGPQNPTRLVLKWSTENGAEQHAVGTEPADFKGSDWVYELYTTRTEKHLGVHLAGGITPLAGQLVEGFPAVPPAGFPFVRRWDGYCDLRRQGNTWTLADGRERGVDLATDTAADADGHVSLTGAASLQLSTLTLDLDLTNQTFVAGDYWLAPVREAVLVPGDVVLDAAPPAGIRHHYLLLATLDNTGAAVAPDTNRQQRLDFPSLTSLAARDVDYTPNCPSGLFNAGHDTVQKALDRVCGIDATQVAFTKPCDTSVFKGVPQATINTVAKALALLCDVRADQVSYQNDEACTALTGATTVQEALTLLCLRESGGGCRTTIGEGGEFPTLKEAVDVLLARGETRLCFCLLPGEHLVEEQLDLTAASGQSLYFSLEGCGPASQLEVQGQFTFTGLASVRLSGLALAIAPNAALKASAGEEVVIEGCTITIPNHDQTQPMQLSASRLVRLAGNDVQVLRTSNLSIGADVLGSEPLLKALFSPTVSVAKFATDVKFAAASLSEQPPSQRGALSSAIKQEIDNRQLAIGPQNLDQSEVQSFQNFRSLVSTSAQPSAASLEKSLLDLRQVLLTDESSLALQLDFGGGDAILVDNRIVGVLALYGKLGLIVLSHSNLSALRARIGSGAVQLQANEESLLLARNRIGQLRAGGDLVIRLRDLSTTLNSGTVAGLFRTVRLTDNFFMRGENVLVGLEATLSGNRFGPMSLGESRQAAVVGNTGYYLGNQGDPVGDINIINAAPRSTDAGIRANLNSLLILDA